MKKRAFAVIVTISMLLSVFAPLSASAETLKFESGHYVIDSADDFSKIVDMSGIYWITKDIELSEDFIPIGTESEPFSGKIFGKLDGNGANKPTITFNMKVHGNSGLIGTLSGGVITNIIVKGTIFAENRTIAGGIAGLVLNGSIENCVNYAEITATGSGDVYIGGIAGVVKSANENLIKNCENYGKITCETSSSGGVGGIVGSVMTGQTELRDCKNEGEILTTVKYAGGIAGIANGKVDGCANFGKITNTKNSSAGICGFSNFKVTNSFNNGEIYGALNASGIVASGDCQNTYNTGKIIAGGTGAGIASEGTVKNSYNIGEISALRKLEIASSSDNTNYYVGKGGLTLNDMKDIEKMPELGNGFVTDGSYPQLVYNKFGTIEKEYQPFEDNRIVVEAEDCDISNGIFQIYNNKKASGGKTIVCPKGNHVMEETKLEKAGLTFEFYAPEEKKYYVWVRALVKSNGGDSIWYAFDYDNYAKQVFGVDAENFQWFLVSSGVLTEGVHTINLIPREYNNELDKVLVSDTIALIPSGTGNAADEGNLTLLFPEPSVKPTAGHPRIWFTEKDIPNIVANLEHPQNEVAYNTHKRYLKADVDGILNTNSTNNYNASALTTIKSYAFEYALTKNEEYGKKAVTAMKNFLDTLRMPEGSYSQGGDIIYAVALVYDWCYDLLTDTDKSELRGGALYIAAIHSEVKWPPTQQSSWGGHGSENQLIRDLFSLGVAVYDEDTYVYNTVMGRIEAQYKPVRDVYYSANRVPYGTDYYNYRFNADVSLFRIMAGMTGENFWGNDGIQYVPYYLMYAQRPDGFPLAEGDYSIYNITSMDKYNAKKTYDYAFTILSSWYQDGYLKAGFYEEQFDLSPSNHIEHLIANDVNLEPESKANLPLSRYFGYPLSTYIARTGWNLGKNSPDVVVSMNMSELNVEDHNHLDVGEFEIYYKGNLASDSGYYQAVRTGEEDTEWGSEYWENYYHQTVAHNCMLITDPSEDLSVYQRSARAFAPINGGGQYDAGLGGQKSLNNTSPETVLSDEHYKASEVLGHEAGDDPVTPDYTYLKGDLSHAYTSKVDGYERSFMFLNLKNEKVPAALIVFDRVVSASPSMKKTYLLHGLNAPEIDGTRTVLKRTENGYNGKLVNDTLLPKADDVSIKQVGENPNEYVVGNKTYKTYPLEDTIAEGGGIRTEISPVSAKKQDYFLNVMQMSDADSIDEPLEAELIETETHYGVKIADRVVLFGNQRNRFENGISFEFEGEENYKITVADLMAGTWTVSANGEEKDVVVSEDGGVASFEGKGGKYILNYKNQDSNKEFVLVEKEHKEYGIKIKINDGYVYTNPAPVMENDRVLVPLRAVFDGLGATVNWNEETNTATAERLGRIVEVTPDSTVAKVAGYETKLDVPAKVIDGRIFVPVRFVAEAFLAKVSWNDVSKTVIISDKVKAPPEGYKTVIDVKWDAGVSTEGADGFNTIDRNTATNWGTSASETGLKWLSYEFTESDVIEKIEVLFARPHQRYFKFDILVSDDGENWTTVIADGKSEVVTEEKSGEYQTINLPKGTTGKFIKINCFGNSVNEANNIIEILFK